MAYVSDIAGIGVEPEVDEQGFFFLCPACDYRNKLVDAGPDAMGRPKLVQTDD